MYNMYIDGLLQIDPSKQHLTIKESHACPSTVGNRAIRFPQIVDTRVHIPDLELHQCILIYLNA